MRHWRSPVRRLLTDHEVGRVVEAIRAAEATTSGEIRVHVEHRCADDPIEGAKRWFSRLGMEATRERNGILIYLAVDDRKFAVVGDSGIHARVGDAFWQAVRDRLSEALAKGRAADGLVSAIQEAGARLAEHFPPHPDDRNELPDEISE